MKDLPVLIIGAGPTGLTLANLLAGMKIPFLIIDKNESPSPDSKAFGIHARSLEIFEQIGIAEKAIAKGKTDNSVHLIIKDQIAGKINLEQFIDGESLHPHFLILPQQETEQLLVEALKEQNQEVYWQHELVHVENKEGEVQAIIKRKSGEDLKLIVQYLIGCDGAKSTVRKKAGFSFEGKTFSPTFYLADCEIDWKFPHGDFYFILAPYYLSGVFSYRKNNTYRVFNFINDVIDKENGTLSEEEIQKIINDNPFLKMHLKSVTWTSVFKIHSRYTTNFNLGRIFLAGDAAHVHSPAGGQGMNTGIQDAYNLAWKLNLTLKNIADPKILNTYHEERFVIAKNLHETTDRFFSIMIQKNKFLDFFRLHIFPILFRILFGFKVIRKKLFRRASQIAIHYQHSKLSKGGSLSNFKRKSPQPGDRMPYFKIRINNIDADSYKVLKFTHFVIFVAISDPEEEDAKKLVADIKSNGADYRESYVLYKTHHGGSFFKTFGIKKNAIIIVRPDGHIGFRTARLQFKDIQDYFTAILGSP